MTWTHTLLPACAVVLVACVGVSEPAPLQDYGFVFLDAEAAGDQDAMEPTAYFYRTSRPVPIPSSGVERDRCNRGPVTTPPDPGIQPTISAGAALTLSVSGTETELAQLIRPTVRFYGISTGASVSFLPGDTATIAIPGESGWFPAWTVQVKTAEAFTAAQVPTYEKPTPIQLEWTAGGSTSSRMLVTLRYLVQGGGPEQVQCELVDDGSHELPADWVDAWRVASRFGKSATFLRERIVTLESESSTLTVITTYRVGG